MPAPSAEVVRIGLIEFPDTETAAVWWIGLSHFAPEFAGRTLADCDDEQEFTEVFEGSTCLETHPPYPARYAIDRARTLARERGLPLYRVTRFTDRSGGQCSVYEEID
jgi:hypothetical protein